MLVLPLLELELLLEPVLVQHKWKQQRGLPVAIRAFFVVVVLGDIVVGKFAAVGRVLLGEAEKAAAE